MRDACLRSSAGRCGKSTGEDHTSSGCEQSRESGRELGDRQAGSLLRSPLGRGQLRATEAPLTTEWLVAQEVWKVEDWRQDEQI